MSFVSYCSMRNEFGNEKRICRVSFSICYRWDSDWRGECMRIKRKGKRSGRIYYTTTATR